MSFTPDEIRVLKAIAQGVLGGGVPTRTTVSTARSAGSVATDRMLDGKGGNPNVFNDPKRWSGESYKGRPYSECPPEYLEILADAMDYKADRQDESGDVGTNGKPKSEWSRRDGALARGWAARNRLRHVAPVTQAAQSAAAVQQRLDEPEPGPDPLDDDIPF